MTYRQASLMDRLSESDQMVMRVDCTMDFRGYEMVPEGTGILTYISPVDDSTRRHILGGRDALIGIDTESLYFPGRR